LGCPFVPDVDVPTPISEVLLIRKGVVTKKKTPHTGS